MTSRREITRRAALGTMAAAGLGYAAWPIRPRQRAVVPAGRAHVTYWEKWSGAEAAALQTIIDRFNESQNEIWVTRLPVSDIVVKALIAIAGNDAPDVIGLFDYNIPQFAEAGAIQALDTIDPSAPVVSSARYAPAVWALLSYEDRPWAGITTSSTMALYYDRAALAEVDRAPPLTVAELDDCAALALVRRRPDGALDRIGFLPSLPHWWPYIWPVMFDGPLWDAATQKVTTTSPRTVAAYEWVSSYPKRYGHDAVRRFGSGFGRSFLQPEDPFFTGRTPMVVQGPWLANFIRQFAPTLDYGCVPMPTVDPYDPDRPTGKLEADVVVVPRGAKEPEAAATFIRYLQQQDVLEELAAAHGKSSPLADVTPSFGTHHVNPYVDVHDRIAKSPNVHITPRTRVWPQYAKMMASAFDAIWSGGDVHAELGEVETRIQQLVDLARRRRTQRDATRLGVGPGVGAGTGSGTPS